MRRSAGVIASQISQALISASTRTVPARKWTPLLEQTLHRLGCRDSLSPALVAQVINPFLLNHPSLALGFFNWASQQPGYFHTSSSYQAILYTLSNSRQFHCSEKLLNEARAQKLHLEPSVYRSIIDSNIAGKKSNIAFSVFNQARSLIPEIGRETCNSLLAALSSDGNLKSARQVFDEMLGRGISLNTVGFGVYMWRFCRNAEVGQIFNLLDEVRNVGFSMINGSIIAVLVVHGLCSESRAVDAIRALDDLRKNECKPDFLAYRIVAEALREIRSVDDVEKVLKKKRKLGVAPRANDYKEFIFALISNRLLCEAKELAEAIVNGNFPVDDDVLNILVGSVSATDPCAAVSFLKCMLLRERLPTLLTLINLSENLCKHEKIDELVEVFDILSAREYFRDIQSYNVMITFLCNAGRVQKAYQALQDMKRKGLALDVSSYNVLLEACCREDLLRPAKRLWDEMFSNGCSGTLKTYKIFIQKFLEIGEGKEAYRLFCQMLEKGITPNEIIYKSLLGGLCQAKDLDTAFKVFNKCVEQDEILGQSIFSTFILCLCREGFLSPAHELLSNQICDLRNLDSHATFLKFVATVREVSLGIKHLQWVGDNSPMMLPALHEKLIAMASSSSELDPLLDFFREHQGAEGAGYLPLA